MRIFDSMRGMFENCAIGQARFCLALPARHAKRDCAGQAVLVFLLLLGALIVFLGLAVGFSGFIESSLGRGQINSQEAYALALSGIDDAVLRLILDKSFASSGYTISSGNGTATVTVEQNQPQPGQVRISAVGVVRSSKRKIQVIANVNATTGKVDVVSKQEIAL